MPQVSYANPVVLDDALFTTPIVRDFVPIVARFVSEDPAIAANGLIAARTRPSGRAHAALTFALDCICPAGQVAATAVGEILL